MQQPSIMLVEDDPTTSDVLSVYLTSAGYAVRTADSVKSARECLAMGHHDVVLLDVQLPDGSGLSLVPEMVNRGNRGIIILSRRSEAVDRVIGLEVGADDYVTKPYDPRELLARIAAVRRRLSSEEVTDISPARFDGWSLSDARRCICLDTGEERALTRLEHYVLGVFVRNPRKVLRREAIMEAVNRHWGPTDRTVDVVIGRIRRKIVGDGSIRDPFVTVYGEGYLFDPQPVRRH